eukprot:CAMPEP_0206494710 /NCGR_PEP_ID=MMETSP0324_2-20121206/47928_1 /ASSEMBLY_ACC=CAM_ASM_000836 /TAXON_ID=2866 /ORGANISM="Crypthecodinium cohnii, Strain Seligo" /LENGTH=239 /DNA_ID=CAMNT_0053978493 /DNA_START=71 /DNA_END=786 /DNA_ORIENTATION=-
MAEAVEVDTIIFDLDDTLYPVSNGFSDLRNTDVICGFMIEKLGFTDRAAALEVRHAYFKRYHSSMKGLKVACDEGKTPLPFREEDLAAYFAERCEFERLKPDPSIKEVLMSLKEAGLKLAVYSNAPRRYVQRCLLQLELDTCFEESAVFGVEDALPACKPEREAFEYVLKALNTTANRTVMVEDSMKNVRACHDMGMQTVLIVETAGGDAALLDDLPCASDPAVGCVLENVAQLRERQP